MQEIIPVDRSRTKRLCLRVGDQLCFILLVCWTTHVREKDSTGASSGGISSGGLYYPVVRKNRVGPKLLFGVGILFLAQTRESLSS